VGAGARGEEEGRAPGLTDADDDDEDDDDDIDEEDEDEDEDEDEGSTSAESTSLKNSGLTRGLALPSLPSMTPSISS